MEASPFKSLSELAGERILHWSGTQMALGGGSHRLSEDALEDGVWREIPVVWEHDSIPYLQFTFLDMHVASGSTYRIQSLLAEPGGRGGLMMERVQVSEPSLLPITSSIFWSRSIPELPPGRVDVKFLRMNDVEDVLEAILTIGELELRLLSAEVYEREGGRFEICGPDETLLVQVDGQRPNWSFHRTADGGR